MSDPRDPFYREKLKAFRRFDKVVFDVAPRAKSQAKIATRGKVTSGISPYTGPWGEKEVSHLLKRTLFGVKREELDRFMSMSLQDCVTELLQPENTLSPPVNNYFDFVEASDRYKDVPEGETWVNASHVDNLTFYRQMSLKSWWIQNILQQSTSLHQKLMLFWHGILPTQIFDAGLPGVSYQYVELLHKHTFGNYKSFLHDITINPAMLLYLNGAANVAEAPDENYARELQELFTIGKGPDAAFTENDVFEAARVLTGWSVSWDSIINQGKPQTVFNYYNHDSGIKQFSSFYNDLQMFGKTGNRGQEETVALLDMIFDNPETALYLCRRFYNFFVYHEIDQHTEETVIQPLATIFRDNNYDVAPVVRTLLESEHFFDLANRGAYIKSPADHFLGMIRVLGVPIPEGLTENYEFMQTIYWLMANIGFEIGDPPSVSGWQAYYQQPGFDKIWINTDTVTKRAQYQDYVLYGSVDLTEFVATLNNPSDPNELILESALLLHGIDLDESVRNGLKDILLTGQQTDAYWTIAWEQYVNEPGNEEYRQTVVTRLQSMYRSMLQLSEFQLF